MMMWPCNSDKLSCIHAEKSPIAELNHSPLTTYAIGRTLPHNDFGIQAPIVGRRKVGADMQPMRFLCPQHTAWEVTRKVRSWRGTLRWSRVGTAG